MLTLMTAVAVKKRAKERIDTLLVERGLVESRQRARALLLAGQVRVHGQPVTKPGTLVDPGADVQVSGGQRFVSRGGEKLHHALGVFGVNVSDYVCVDIGASTGGFTDCLLQRGARRVYAVDVGYGVLDYRLRQDPRVVVTERTNAREMTPLPEACDLATIDVSFIGVEKVLPAAMRSLKADGEIVALVKPQFQAGKSEVGKSGVVKDPQVHAAVLGRVIVWAVTNGLRLLDLSASPLLGPAGNREFFLHLRKLQAGRGT